LSRDIHLYDLTCLSWSDWLTLHLFLNIFSSNY
jgi:hypothetical protein